MFLKDERKVKSHRSKTNNSGFINLWEIDSLAGFLIQKRSLRMLLILLAVCGIAFSQQIPESLQQEESEDYFKKWLDEDVVYIITEEEREVFENLNTAEEREQFIEQFWFRRDPDPLTSYNEFKEEHYRRIAYANEHFRAGFPGWMTDRGRIYIIHGPPAEIESHASGGSYERPMSEGGGSTSTFPFEIWRYRNIEGIGSDIELEFVDPSLSGEYRLALMPEEKDALLHVPGAGLTIAEQMGVANKADRPYFSPGNRDRYPMMTTTAKDNPFNRYETYTMVQRPVSIKYKDLKEIVEVNISYSELPFEAVEHFFALNQKQVLVPVSIAIENRELSFVEEGGMRVARVAVYGMVTSITNKVIAEFEDDLVTSIPTHSFETGLLRSSIYQKTLLLDQNLRYKLDLVIQDQNSEKTGVLRRAIVPPQWKDEGLVASSLLLSDSLQVLDKIPADEMFLIGDVKIRPSMDNVFDSERPVHVYLQVYNAEIDQASLMPSLSIQYEIRSGREVIWSVSDDRGESIQFFSGQRVVLVQKLDLEGLPEGSYLLRTRIKDRLNTDQIQIDQDFSIH
jgi:GWxTD domain-containing protein